MDDASDKKQPLVEMEMTEATEKAAEATEKAAEATAKAAEQVVEAVQANPVVQAVTQAVAPANLKVDSDGPERENTYKIDRPKSPGKPFFYVLYALWPANFFQHFLASRIVTHRL